MKNNLIKRILPLLLIAAMVFAVLPAISFADGKYDLNGDKIASIEDVSALLDVLSVGTIDTTYDLNGDGVASIDDVSALLDYLSNPVEEETMQDIVDAAYALEAGSSLEEEKTLTGSVVSIDTAYDANYGNLTVTIVVEGREDYPIQCFRLKGLAATEDEAAVDVSAIAVGDVITVTGTLKNYNGKIEFDAGCICTEILAGANQALAILENVAFTGTVNSGDEEEVPDTIENVRMTYAFAAADGGPAPVTVENELLTYGQVNESTAIVITVTANDGTHTASKTFNVTILPEGVEETMEDIVNAAYALEENEVTSEVKTLTGVITEITDVSTNYGNATFTIVVGTLTDMPIYVYRAFPADGVELSSIVLDAEATVTGYIKNYRGTIEFTSNNSVRPSIDSIVEPQLTDKEKLAIEEEQLTINPAAGAVVPLTGSRFEDVIISWSSSDSEVAYVDGDVIVVDNSSLTSAVDVTLTATLSIGELSATKTFNMTVSAPASGDYTAKTWTLTFPDDNSENNKIGSYTTTWTAIKDGQEWTIANFNNNNWNNWTVIKTGRKGNACIGSVRTTIDGKVENFVVTFDSVTAANINSIVLNVLDVSGAVLTTVAIDAITAGEHTFSVPATIQDDGLTYELVVDCASGSSNGLAAISKIEANGYALSGNDDPELTEEEKVQAEIDALTLPTLENGAQLPEHGATYEDVEFRWSTDSEMAYVDGGVLVVDNTLEEGDEDVTVTLTVYAVLNNSVASTEYQFTIRAPEVIPESGTVVFVAGTDTSDTTSITKQGVTVALTSGTLSRTDNYRVYANNSMTISSEKAITSIVITCVAGNANLSAEGGSYDGVVFTWEGAASSVTFSSSSQTRITQIEVTYGELDDKDKVQAEISALPEDLDDGDALPSAGATFTDVAITWSSDNETLVLVENGVLVIDSSSLSVNDPDEIVTVTATVSLNNAYAEKTYEITVSAPSEGGDDPTDEPITETIEATAAFTDGVFTQGDVTLTASNATGFTTYTNPWRFYANSTLVISVPEGKTITSVTITYSQVGTVTGDGYTHGNTGTWTGSASSVTLTSVKQARISSIEVVYE